MDKEPDVLRVENNPADIISYEPKPRVSLLDEELHVLILEDNLADAELIERELRKGSLQFISKRVETKAGFLAGINEFAPNLILADYNLPFFDGLSALEIAWEQSPD